MSSSCNSVNPDCSEVLCERDQHYQGLHTNGFGPGMIMWSDPDPTVGRITEANATQRLLDIRNRAKKESRVN